jgi:formate-dependent nitrite reductase membrane component NrfD
MIEASAKSESKSLGAAHLRARDAYAGVPILKKPTWNNGVAAYFFFGGISAGAAMIGSLANIVGGERNRRLARTAHFVSFATLLPCPPLLIEDLGYPARFHHMLRIFKPSSPMNLGSWALVVHGAGATVTVGQMLAKENKLPLIGPLARLLPERMLAALGFPSSLALAGYTGVLLGTTSIPVWHTSQLLGALFMASSFSTGAAATSLAGLLTGRHESHTEHNEFALLGMVSGITELAVLGGYVATSGEASIPLTEGDQKPLFAGAVAALTTSLVLEAVSLALGDRGKGPSIAAAVSALAGGAMLRWSIVKAGRASANDREGTLEAMKSTPKRQGWWPPGNGR